MLGKRDYFCLRIALPISFRSSAENSLSVFLLIMNSANLEALRIGTVGLFIRRSTLLFAKTSIPSTQILLDLKALFGFYHPLDSYGVPLRLLARATYIIMNEAIESARVLTRPFVSIANNSSRVVLRFYNENSVGSQNNVVNVTIPVVNTNVVNQRVIIAQCGCKFRNRFLPFRPSPVARVTTVEHYGKKQQNQHP